MSSEPTVAFHSTLLRQGLFRGLLTRGVSASAPRGAAIAVGEVCTYDQAKAWLKRCGYADGFVLHVFTSLITGLVATTVAAPFDLLKSRCDAAAPPERVASAGHRNSARAPPSNRLLSARVSPSDAPSVRRAG